MLNLSEISENQHNINTSLILDTQGPPYLLETSDFRHKKLNLEGIDFFEKGKNINDCYNTNNILDYSEPFLENRISEPFDIFDLNEYTAKSNGFKIISMIKGRGKKIENTKNEKNNDINYKKKRKIHSCSSFDNILTKIQVHFINFIIDISNDALRLIIKNKYLHFRQLNYNFKRRITYEYFNRLKEIPIKEVLNQNISEKYRSISKSINKEILIKIIPKSEWLNNFLNMNYLKLFNIYYNNGKPLKKIIFEGKEIILSSKTKPFDNLLKKNIEMKDNIMSVVQDAFFNGNMNNSKIFVTTKKRDMKKEN